MGKFTDYDKPWTASSLPDMRNANPYTIDYNNLTDKQVYEIYTSATNTLEFRENGGTEALIGGVAAYGFLNTIKGTVEGFKKGAYRGVVAALVKDGAKAKVDTIKEFLEIEQSNEILRIFLEDATFHLELRDLQPGTFLTKFVSEYRS